MSLGLLAVALDFSGLPADEFNDWYDLEHLPQRRSVPGIQSAQRWLAADQSAVSVALYDLADLAVLESDVYRGMMGDNYSPWSRRVMARCQTRRRLEADQLVPGEQLAPEGAEALFLVWMNVPAEDDEEFNHWYNTEHLPGLAAVDGVLAARRFKTREATPTYLSTYHLASSEVRQTGPWQEVADSPWSQRMRTNMSNREALSCRAYRRVVLPV